MIRISPVAGLPEVGEGDRVGALVAERADLDDGDVVVISQKIVSKAEGAVRRLAEVVPGQRAREIATGTDKDPRLIQVVLEESRQLIRAERGVLIAETRHGFVCANAGVDASNLTGEGIVATLPRDPDASARRIRGEIRESNGRSPAVVVADSFGRAWRVGQVDVAIGCAGLGPLDDWRGRVDRAGRELTATVIAVADEAAAAADLVRDKDGGIPAAVISGLGRYVTPEDGPGAAALLRKRSEDLFR